MAAYFFASPIDIDINLDGEDARKHADIKGDKEKVISCPIYYDGDSVGGQARCRTLVPPYRTHSAQVAIRVRDGKKLTHEGIKVEFVGSIGVLPSVTRSPLRFTRRRALLRPRPPP